ncbi:MAG TPA: ATP-binding protein [Thermoanaerobaculia bacterium]|nr:ATP-binding protein [Thermoanaerobaculia bacterium]
MSDRGGLGRRLADAGRRFARGLSRIWIRLLAFNVLLVFLPAAGLLVLDTYERQLLDAQERSMVQQARLFAAALSGHGELDAGEAERVLVELNQRLEARLRVVDADGKVVADSAALGPRREPGGGGDGRDGDERQPRQSLLYRFGSWLHGTWRSLSPSPELPAARPGLYTAGDDGRLTGRAVQEALAGRYGADLRVTSAEYTAVTTLHSAIPVLSGGGAAVDDAAAENGEAGADGATATPPPARPPAVVGAVLVSQSTGRVLSAITDLRLGIFQVILASVLAAVVLSLLVATTIARPLGRLRDEARAIVDRRGRLTGGFRGSEKHDEIGELARALEELTRRLRRHLEATESFASDVSHEFKNPLASIRSAAEMLASVESDEERRRFEGIVSREVTRLHGLLTSVREISSIDAQLESEEAEPVVLNELLAAVVEGHRLRGRAGNGHGGEPPTVRLRFPDEPLAVRAAPERLSQVAENLLDNAASFSPPGGIVEVELAADGDTARFAVSDAGPGIPDDHAERIFDRFFSYRPEGHSNSRRDGHAGLGLAIVKAIVEGYGGTLHAENRAEGGARFEVTLPLA